MDQAHLTHMFSLGYLKDPSQGHLFFLIYTDDLASLPTSPGSHFVLYADDFLLFRPSRNKMISTCYRTISQ